MNPKSKSFMIALLFLLSIPVFLTVESAPAYTAGVTPINSSQAKLWFKPDGWTASYVILHYTISGAGQQNVYTTYNSTASQWEYTVSNLVSGQTVTYNYTYNTSGVQYDTTVANWTAGGTSTTPTPGKTATPVTVRTATPIRTATPRITRTPTPRVQATPTPAGGWRLVFEEQFDGTSLNRSNWNYQNGNGWNPGSSAFDGWGNGEWEWYREQNVSVSGGNLIIKGEYLDSPISINGRNWYQFSGRITTQGLKSWRYGRIEARISMPNKAGTWPAFWMLGTTSDSTVNGALGGYDRMPSNWSSCGEIDIMEHRNMESVVCNNLFWDTRTGLYAWASDTTANAPTTNTPVGDVTAYHLYTIEWNATQIKWFVDREINPNPVKTININASNMEEFQNSFFIILNLAICGQFTGPTEPVKADFPLYMKVDYVRVWQQ